MPNERFIKGASCNDLGLTDKTSLEPSLLWLGMPYLMYTYQTVICHLQSWRKGQDSALFKPH